MKELEKLKKICDKIDYDIEIYTDHECYDCDRPISLIREVIFTPEFMKKLYDYCDNTPGTGIMECDVRMLWYNLGENLDDPVDFLHTFLYL